MFMDPLVTSQGRAPFMSMLAILGAGGHGKVVADCAELQGWETVHFYDDAWPDRVTTEHWPIQGSGRHLLQNLRHYGGVFVAIGNNRRRCSWLQVLAAQGAPIVSLIHPAAMVSRYAELGMGTLAVAGCIVNAFTRCGEGTIINTGATVGHDCLLGQGVHVAPGANLAGHVVVGAYTWVGIGARVIQCVTIGKGVFIGAGATVIGSVRDGEKVVGTPARPLRDTFDATGEELSPTLAASSS